MPTETESERPGEKFEREVGQELDSLRPHSRLSKVLLFRPDLPVHRRYGFEIDHLLHLRDGLVDRLFIIECKAQPVTIQSGQWLVNYRDGGENVTKNAKEQLRNQAVSVLQHLGDTEEGRQIKVEACLLSSYHLSSRVSGLSDHPSITFHLFNKEMFFEWLKTQITFAQRVEQSSILSRLRQGVAVNELGRPDIGNAISFVADCRKSLDQEMFRNFPVSSVGMTWSSHAAINGTAGMGKSVMLAYILFVLSCDYYVEADETTGTRRLVPLGSNERDLGLPPHARRSIVAFGMSQKQVSILRALWRHFVQLFGALDNGHLLHFHQPTFKVWDAVVPDECNVLAVDEAHDLPLEAQRIIAGWKNVEDETRYLLVACDRHQRLRLAGHGATIIDGLAGDGFSRHTLKMRRNYRSPFPVYAASIGIMFRWFACSGPKIIPSDSELKDAFGFKVEPRENGGPWVLTDINDSHPGNHWCYTVSRFLNAHDAFRQIQSLKKEDVLWVRFSEEEAFFDYEQLSAFTYHPMDGWGVPSLIDKYIKGQDFSVVVIEGFPPAAADGNFSPDSRRPDEAEQKMWQARRELYLCASRANVFLLFVIKPGSPCEHEIEEMLSYLRSPHEAAKRMWRLQFGEANPVRRPADVDNIADESTVTPVPSVPESIVKIHAPRPLTFGGLLEGLARAKGLDQKTSTVQALEAVGPFKLTGLVRSTLLPMDKISDLEERLGVLIEFDGEDDVLTPEGAAVQPEGTAANSGGFIPTNPLRPGISVQEAASLIGTKPQNLLQTLPVSYSSSSILTESDLLRIRPDSLISASPPTDEKSSSVTPKEPQHLVTSIWRTPLGEQLWSFVQSPEFSRESKMVVKYVKFLTELANKHPAAGDILLRYRPRNRIYFARAKSEIIQKHDYASVHSMGKVGLFAMCTLSNESKFSVLRSVLGDCGLGPDEIRRLLGKF